MHLQTDNSGRPAGLRYGVAVAAVVVAVGLKYGLDRIVQIDSPFVLCFGAVMLAGYFGGLGPGLLATLLAAILAEGTELRANYGREHYGGIIAFVAEGILISLICAAMDLARRRAVVSAAEVRDSRAELQQSQTDLAEARQTVRDRDVTMAARDRTIAAAQGFSDNEAAMVQEVKDYAIFLLDSVGVISSWNDGATRLFGYPQSEALGMNGRKLFTLEDQAKGVSEEELETARREGRAGDDRWMMRKDGSRFWASGVTTALKDAAGGIRGFTKVCRDLTANKAHELEREQLLEREQAARAEADVASRVKDEFLAVVSHELRTPLSAILLWAKMMRDRSVKAEDMDEGLRVIVQSAESQKQLIEDLLDISRIMSGKLRMELRDTDLKLVVEGACDSVRPMAEVKGVEIDCNMDERAGIVRADPDRIQQVVWNLLTNAVKFTPAGGSVRVAMRRMDEHVRIEVIDTGRGIAAEFLPYVFDRFSQAENPLTRQIGGLGLGLAIARELVQLHGGTIQARSPGEGRGATFTVDLPLADMRPTFAARRSGTAIASTGAGARFEPAPVLDGVRVLLVEDDAPTRRGIQLLLEQCAAQVTAVDGADEALERLESGDGEFDLIVSDISMPGKDGYEMLRQVRQREKERGRRLVPAVALSALAREEDRQRALAAGFVAHLPKPVEPGELVATARRVLGRK